MGVPAGTDRWPFPLRRAEGGLPGGWVSQDPPWRLLVEELDRFGLPFCAATPIRLCPAALLNLTRPVGEEREKRASQYALGQCHPRLWTSRPYGVWFLAPSLQACASCGRQGPCLLPAVPLLVPMGPPSFLLTGSVSSIASEVRACPSPALPLRQGLSAGGDCLQGTP